MFGGILKPRVSTFVDQVTYRRHSDVIRRIIPAAKKKKKVSSYGRQRAAATVTAVNKSRDN